MFDLCYGVVHALNRKSEFGGVQTVASRITDTEYLNHNQGSCAVQI